MNEFKLEVSCGECNQFEGEVVAWEDELLGAWGWTCPNCGQDFEDSFGLYTDEWPPSLDGYDDDDE